MTPPLSAANELPPRRLCVFLRAPELGRVKTRLAGEIGDRAALAAYERLVEHLLGCLDSAPAVKRELWYAGDGGNAQLEQWAATWAASLLAQPEGDLGVRMLAGLRGAGAGPGPAAPAAASLLVGADCAGLTAAHCEQAWRILDADPEAWVFAPAEDGGFGLVGCRSAAAWLGSPFAGVDWEAGDTLSQCRERAGRLGLAVRLIEPLWDVDTAADWARFQQTFG
ncbi:MAG: TIGR04282 family arsenosugar biosynthesis glycosyltransferase [Pseudomonadota bacterium]